MVCYSTKAPFVISRVFGDEVVLANWETGLYYSLTSSGADIWRGLEAGHSVESIALAFANAGGVDDRRIAEAVHAFVSELSIEHLIVPLESAAAVVPWHPTSAGRVLSPQLEKYDDLKDLLLLDPVHEVTEEGWPHRTGDRRERPS